MSELLLVTGVLEPSSEVLPALGLLLHSVRVLPADASALVEAPPADVVLVDARRDLAHAKSICRLLHTTGLDCPMVAIVTEGGLAAISAEWNADDVILNTAGPAVFKMTSSAFHSALIAASPPSVTMATIGQSRPVVCSRRQILLACARSRRASTSTTSAGGASTSADASAGSTRTECRSRPRAGRTSDEGSRTPVTSSNSLMGCHLQSCGACDRHHYLVNTNGTRWQQRPRSR